MNKFLPILAVALLLSLWSAPSIKANDYTFFVRQVQMPDESAWDVTVTQEGQRQSLLEINPNGARFELWAIKSNPLTSFLLDTTYVNSYVPVAQVSITSEDPYDVIPRTRADQPFTVNIIVSGLSSDPAAPAAAKTIKILRHVQAYAADGDGSNVNRSQAIMHTQGSITSNGAETLNYALTSIPGADRSKVRGEERFSAFSLEDYQAPESQLSSKFIQIWPVADSTILGMPGGTIIKGAAPHVDIQLRDLYPDSFTYAQVYEGPAQLGTVGTLVPGASLVVNGSIPRNETLNVRNWDTVIPTDGVWTLEVLTETPFGTDRLGFVSFTVDRAIKINGSVTSVD